VVGGLLPLALVVAISPTTITVVILILLSGRRRLVSVAFAIGYTLGIAIATTALLALGGVAGLSNGQPSEGAVAWLQLVVGVLLLLYGLQQWTKRPQAGDEIPVPKWMTAVEDLTVVKSLLVSLVLSALRPKNVLMFAAATVTIAAGYLPVYQDVIAIAIFTLISASTVFVLVLVALVRREQIYPTLTKLKAWLQLKNRAMMSVVLVLVGVVEIGKGLDGIF
jgi:threonine/homoserine/homoserine lactone efflux protein